MFVIFKRLPKKEEVRIFFSWIRCASKYVVHIRVHCRTAFVNTSPRHRGTNGHANAMSLCCVRSLYLHLSVCVALLQVMSKGIWWAAELIRGILAIYSKIGTYMDFF